MLIMKMIDEKHRVRIVELLKAGRVQFDPRPNWLLTSVDIGKRGRARHDMTWIHSDDVKVEWVREFSAL